MLLVARGSSPKASALFLGLENFTEDHVGDTDPARARDRLAVFVHLKAAPGVLARAAREGGFRRHLAEHRLQHLGEEEGFEIAGDLARLLLARLLAERRGHRLGGEIPVDLDGHGGVGAHHNTPMSACIAPGAFIACRMVIRTPGPMPSALRPLTSSCKGTPWGRTASWRSAPSSIWMSVRWTVVVVPTWAKGP